MHSRGSAYIATSAALFLEPLHCQGATCTGAQRLQKCRSCALLLSRNQSLQHGEPQALLQHCLWQLCLLQSTRDAAAHNSVYFLSNGSTKLETLGLLWLQHTGNSFIYSILWQPQTHPLQNSFNPIFAAWNKPSVGFCHDKDNTHPELSSAAVSPGITPRHKCCFTSTASLPSQQPGPQLSTSAWLCQEAPGKLQLHKQLGACLWTVFY